MSGKRAKRIHKIALHYYNANSKVLMQHKIPFKTVYMRFKKSYTRGINHG